MSMASGAVVVERPPPYGARREARGAVQERRPVFFVGPVTVGEIDVGDDPWDPAELAPVSYVVYNGAQIARRLRSFYATTDAGAAKHSTNVMEGRAAAAARRPGPGHRCGAPNPVPAGAVAPARSVHARLPG